MIGRLDAFLLAVPVRTRHLVIAMTLLVMVGVALRDVPRAYVDYTHVPILNHIPQHESYGPDTIADVYESKVILNDPRDMYTKRELPQTPLEAATWTKEASAPYPPAVLLAEAGLYALGARSGLGFYGVVLGLMGLFFGLSIYYFLSTRWYLFPVLYLNFLYVGYRFVYVQDNSYLIMLVVITAALVLARARRPESHALMALAIIMKLSPLAYLRELPTMRRRMA